MSKLVNSTAFLRIYVGLLLAVVTVYYLHSLKSSAVAANTQLFIDAWNAKRLGRSRRAQ